MSHVATCIFVWTIFSLFLVLVLKEEQVTGDQYHHVLPALGTVVKEKIAISVQTLGPDSMLFFRAYSIIHWVNNTTSILVSWVGNCFIYDHSISRVLNSDTWHPRCATGCIISSTKMTARWGLAIIDMWLHQDDLHISMHAQLSR